MVLELSKSYIHEACTQRQKQYSDNELQGILLDLLEKNGVPRTAASVSPEGNLELNTVNDLKLHTLVLQAEELGLEMKFTKKTLIEIC